MVSVIVPVYNVGKYLPKCIKSVQEQSYKNLEIILVDDGSTDNSGAICDRFALSDSRIKVIHKTNGGPDSARKEGLSVAQGQYIGFVDGDDFIEQGMYEALVSSLEDLQVDFIHSGYLKNDGQQFSVKYKRKYILNNNMERVQILKESVFDTTDEQLVTPSIWSKLFKRELLLKVYPSIPDSLSYGEDLLCLCGCMMECGSFGTLPEAYYHYVQRAESICNERKLENVQRETELYKALQSLLGKHGFYKELKDDVEHFYLRNLLACMKHLTNAVCPVYQYPDMEGLAGKRVVLYGAGAVGQDYYTQLCRDMRCTVAAVADKHYDRYHLDFMRVIGADGIRETAYDVIVIAVLHSGTAEAIREDLTKRGIEREKILWKRPQTIV